MIRSMPEHEIEARMKRKKLDQVESNVPMELCMVLTSYTVFLMRSSYLQNKDFTSAVPSVPIESSTPSDGSRFQERRSPLSSWVSLRLDRKYHFCLSVQRELHEISADINPEPSSFIFSAW
ncbi:hypothetical protein DXG01_006694 [Tephrocybe rancida]|nr:hypothetical protein DXG01_006694 [Tephrocybe rancida]